MGYCSSRSNDSGDHLVAKMPNNVIKLSLPSAFPTPNAWDYAHAVARRRSALRRTRSCRDERLPELMVMNKNVIGCHSTEEA